MATMVDVARLAGVSIATVSRTLSGKNFVSPEVRKQVMDAVRQLDFQPDHMAQGLRRGRGNTVALIVSDVQQGVNSALTKYLQTALSEFNFDLLLYNLGHTSERLERFLDRAERMRLTGIVFAVTDEISLPVIGPRLKALIDKGLIVVAVGQRLDEYGIPSVLHEERAATLRSVDYLVQRQLTPVAFIGRITGSVLGAERYQGYVDALKKNNIPVDESLVWNKAYRYTAGYEAVTEALGAGKVFRSIQASSDEIAQGAIAALYDHGVMVPKDVAVIGVGNVDWSPHTRPALTTVGSQPEVVATRVQQIFRSYQQGATVSSFSEVERPFIVRASA